MEGVILPSYYLPKVKSSHNECVKPLAKMCLASSCLQMRKNAFQIERKITRRENICSQELIGQSAEYSVLQGVWA